MKTTGDIEGLGPDTISEFSSQQNHETVANETSILKEKDFHIEDLETVSRLDETPVPFTLNGKRFELAASSKKINAGIDLVVFGIWDENGKPVAYIDCIHHKTPEVGLVDLKSHHKIYSKRSPKFKTLDDIYVDSDSQGDKTESAFFVAEAHRGRGSESDVLMADFLQAQCVYVMNRLGCGEITYSGDTTVRTVNGEPSSFYSKDADDWLIDMDPEYPEGTPYTGPSTTISTKLSKKQREILTMVFN